MRSLLIVAALMGSVSPLMAASSNVNSMTASGAIVGTQLLYCPTGVTADLKCTFSQVADFINSQGIIAGTTSTSGFAAGQLIMSDGSKVQASPLVTGTFGGAMTLIGQPGGTGVILYGDGSAVPQLNFNNLKAGWWTLHGSGGLQIEASTTAQAFRVYNTYTDGSNGEWAALDWQTTPNVLTIGTQANGTGTARPIQFMVGVGRMADFGYTVPGYWSFNTILPIVTDSVNMGQVAHAWGEVVSNQFVSSGGTQPTIAGSGGTCATSTKVGGPTAGTVVLSGVCASGNTIVFTGMPSVGNGASNGWACDAQDRTTRTAGPFIESATTLTGFTLTVVTTSSVAGDVLQWKCMGY